MTLLRLHQSIEVALHAVHELFSECPLNLSATQRTRQGPADPPPIKASIEPISPGVNRSWANAQIRCAATPRLPAAFLDIPTVQAHATSPIHISVKRVAPCSAFNGSSGRKGATPRGGSAVRSSSRIAAAIFAIIGSQLRRQAVPPRCFRVGRLPPRALRTTLAHQRDKSPPARIRPEIQRL